MSQDKSEIGKEMLMESKFYMGYSRWMEEQDRYETWAESVTRVMDMHREKYAHVMTDKLSKAIQFAQDVYADKKVLGAQRALQFGGEQLFAHNSRIFNCFDVNESFVTSEGVKKFSDFEDGDKTTVLTHTGQWKPATVKAYGTQTFNRVTFGKQKANNSVLVTPEHRWILKNGTETTNLKVGDRIYKPVNTFGEFDYDTATPEERLYWCYGLVYGDGTRVQYKGEHRYSMIRLCGNDKQFSNRFKELGFKISTNDSLNGDFFAFTGTYLKTAPDPAVDSPEMIRAFVAGYLQADGEKNKNSYGSRYLTIQSSEKDHIDFIRKCFPIAGVWLISETDLTGQVTNYGTRPYTIRFRVSTSIGSEYNTGWYVRDIEENVKSDTAWCLEVEEDHSFVMPNGVVTGNCTVSHVDRPEFFQECMYMLLSGCGVGFSVQKQHISQMPPIKKRYSKKSKVFTVPDNIEGWADAFGVLMSSYLVGGGAFPEYEGCQVHFDFHKIRPRGAYISGGFKAPGPDGLRQSLQKCEDLLDKDVQNATGHVTVRPIVAYDYIMHMADAVLSGGVRRCLPKGSKVFMRDGVKNIEDVMVGEEVLTPYGYHKVNNNFVQGKQQLVTITTQDGSFECTPNHKMPVLNSMNDYDWVRAEELKEGDILITNTTAIEGRLTALPTDEDITIPELDEDMAWFVGLLHGDGANSSLVFKSEQYDMAVKAKAQLERFDTTSQLVKNMDGNCYVLDADSEQVTHYLSDNIKQPNTTMIPDFIWNAVADVKQAYVSGLMDAAGSRNNPMQPYTTVNEQNAKDIQTLLYSCGITTRLNNDQQQYSVSLVNSQDCALMPVKVLSIENSRVEETFDIEVDEVHQFYCNGYLTHNSATICMFSKDDEEMLNAKTGNWFISNPQRGRSNNSVALKRDEVTREEWAHIMKSVKQFGEPGFIFTDNLEFCFNPCQPAWAPMLKESGLCEMKDVAVGDKVWTKEGWTTVAKKWSTGVKDVYRYRTTAGVFYGTENHRVVSNGEKIEAKDASSIDALQGPLVGAHVTTVVRPFTKEAVTQQQILLSSQGIATFVNEDEDELAIGESENKIISVEYVSTEEVFDITVDNEAHTYWTGGVNVSNCVEIGMLPKTKDGRSGFQGCNLSEINGGACTTKEQLFEAAEAASILGTLQAGYTDFKYLGAASKEIFDREALIGVSITGWMNNPDILFDKQNMIDAAEIVKKVNKRIAKLIGINTAARTTCTKPSGNACTTTNTMINTEHGDMSMEEVFEYVTSEKIDLNQVDSDTWVEINNSLKVYDENDDLQEVTGFYVNGVVETYDVEFEDSYVYTFTGNHKLKTVDGWKHVSDLLETDKIISYNESSGFVGIGSISKNTDKRLTVDIEVDNTHSYQLHNGAVSHNSVILGTASGIHGEHSPLYFRNVQMNEQDEVLHLIEKTNPKMVETSVWSANGTDKVVSFPVVTPEGSMYKDDLMGVKQLEYVKLAQQYWVEYGTNEELCVDKALRHNVSNTITVDDWDEVEEYIYNNRYYFAGISLMSAMGDKAFPQAPFTQVFTAQEIMDEYGEASMFASGLIVDGLHAFDNNLWTACETLTGMGLDLDPECSDHLLMRDWIRRANKFARNYFDDDLGRMISCLKDCFNLHKWQSIHRKLTPIDFTTSLSQKQFTEIDTMGAVACSGDSCEVTF